MATASAIESEELENVESTKVEVENDEFKKVEVENDEFKKVEVEHLYNRLKESFGEPREGFERFRRVSLKKNLHDSKPSNICKYFKVDYEMFLHDIMLQPFYDNRFMKAKPNDVIIASYPRTGSSWIQEIVFLIVYNCDFSKALSEPALVRTPFLDIPLGGIKAIEKLESPRILKTHLPYGYIPDSFHDNKSKIIYVTRNPKDTVVSYYLFLKMVAYYGLDESFLDFVTHFILGRICYNSFAEHVAGFWAERERDNILFLFYEDLHKDVKKEIGKIAKFLEKDVSDENVDKIADHCSFENMAKNPMCNYSSNEGAIIKNPEATTSYFRSGKVGDWPNYFEGEHKRTLENMMSIPFEKELKDLKNVFQYVLKDGS
ncbi:hypothetical protein CHUAL_012538 [Chamberlinius hualienensis]